MRKLFLLNILWIAISAQGQEVNIIPKPTSLNVLKGTFTISPATYICAPSKDYKNSIDFLNDYLQKFYGFKLKVTYQPRSLNTIVLTSSNDETASTKYDLNVFKTDVTIDASNQQGLFYGIQTLIQLLPIEKKTSLNIPQVKIEDEPHFSYRGMHLDCGRHFFSVAFIKKYIDYLALHKFNYFHWHLTEDQGWRIEIKKYPRLTKFGAWRNGTIIGRYPGKGNDGIHYGGFYTQEQIKGIVKYAADRYITVVPEIEMPGHSSAAIASYPELSCFPDEPTIKYYPKQCAWNGDSTGKQVEQTWGVFDDVYCAGKENTFKFIEDVLDEVMALFPSKYIHVGGDECPKENWKRCPLCQKRIKDEGLKDEHALQSYFIQRIEKYLNSKGRTLIGWDEILEGGLAPNAVVMSWRGEQGGIDAARQNHDVIMTPGGWCYFDHSQSENEDSVTIGGYTSVEKVYGYDPVPDSLNEEQAKHILGAQGNVWTEYMSNNKKVEYMIFPRMSALSEVLWSQQKDSADFFKRLMPEFKRYAFWKVNYSKAYFDLKATVLPTEDFNGVYWKIESKVKGDTILFHDYANQKMDCLIKQFGKKPDTVYIIALQTLPYVKRILCSDTYGYTLIKKNVETPLFLQDFKLNKATGKKITLANPPSKNYPGDGAFTLVNGIQNEKGLARTKEFLGFQGTDCEAVIDLGKTDSIKNVKVHILNQVASWIWRPAYVEIFSSNDGTNFTSIGLTDDVSTLTGNGVLEKSFTNVTTRYVKVLVKNWGEIPQGNPGAGSKPWLFVDEIEVN